MDGGWYTPNLIHFHTKYPSFTNFIIRYRVIMTRINCGALQMINLVLNVTAQTHDWANCQSVTVHNWLYVRQNYK